MFGLSDKCQDFHMIYEKNKELCWTRHPQGGKLTGYMINECCITGSHYLCMYAAGINSTDRTYECWERVNGCY